MATINRNYKRNWFNKPIGISVSGHVKEYATYQEMLSDNNPGKFGWVIDASQDPTVDAGAAYYRYDFYTKLWTKIFEQEVMDSVDDDNKSYIGWFATPEDLTEQYPVGQNGLRAMVGTTDTVWTWDIDTNQWVNTAPGSVDVNALTLELNERAPINVTFTSADLDYLGRLHVHSTKPPRGILSQSNGTYFAIAPENISSEGDYLIDLRGLMISGTWSVIF